jgi:hypothetical protein
MGDLLKANGLKVFTIETTLNNDTFPDPFGFMNKREWEWSLIEQGTYLAARKANELGPSSVKHQVWRGSNPLTASPASTPARPRPSTSRRWRGCTINSWSRSTGSPTSWSWGSRT